MHNMHNKRGDGLARSPTAVKREIEYWAATWHADHEATLSQVTNAVAVGDMTEASFLLRHLFVVDEKGFDGLTRMISALGEED